MLSLFRCSISEHEITNGELAKKILEPSTTAGCIFLLMLNEEDFEDENKLVEVLKEKILTWPVELFPMAMIDKRYESTRNTWHKVCTIFCCCMVSCL